MQVEILGKGGLQVVNLNRRRAIRENCLSCCAWFKPDVKNCIFPDCDLFPFRMGIGKQNPAERARAIRQYCLWCCAGSLSEVSKCHKKTCPLYPYRNTRVDRSVFIAPLRSTSCIEAFSGDNNAGA